MTDLTSLLDPSEKILWQGKPSFLPFMAKSLFMVVPIGLVFLLIVRAMPIEAGDTIRTLLKAAGLFLILVAPILNFIAFFQTRYAITNRRVLIQGGQIYVLPNILSTDFDQITNAGVSQGKSDIILGMKTGNIYFYTHTPNRYIMVNNRRVPDPYILSSIPNPYEVFKFFKTTEFDVKTDMKFPNQYRPNTNPGSLTKYKPKK